MKKICVTSVLLVLILAFDSTAQEVPNLVKPEVPESYTLFKKTVWRRMDLQEKQNTPFFSRNGEISKLLIEAVDEGLLRPYRSDSCINFMPDIVFVSNISVEQADNPFVGGGFGGFDSGDDDSGAAEEPADEGPKLDAIPAALFSVLYIKEEVIFDRNRSRMLTYMKSISLALPASVGADWNPGGFEKIVAHFKYDEVVSLFKNDYNEKAIWYNVQNQAQHLNYADAFELRMFNAPIIKISNAQDLDIRQEYQDAISKDPMVKLIIQQKYEYDLMEYEAELWEY